MSLIYMTPSPYHQVLLARCGKSRNRSPDLPSPRVCEGVTALRSGRKASDMLSSHVSWAGARYQSLYTACSLHVVVEAFVAARSSYPSRRCDLHPRTVRPESDISAVIHVTLRLSFRIRLQVAPRCTSSILHELTRSVPVLQNALKSCIDASLEAIDLR